jgi:hypothetical protein
MQSQLVIDVGTGAAARVHRATYGRLSTYHIVPAYGCSSASAALLWSSRDNNGMGSRVPLVSQSATQQRKLLGIHVLKQAQESYRAQSARRCS